MSTAIILHAECFSDSEVELCERFAKIVGENNVAVALSENVIDPDCTMPWRKIILSESGLRDRFGTQEKPAAWMSHLALSLGADTFPDAENIIYCRDEVYIPDVPEILAALEKLPETLLAAHDTSKLKTGTEPPLQMAFMRIRRSFLEEVFEAVRQDAKTPESADPGLVLLRAAGKLKATVGDLYKLLPEFFDRQLFAAPPLSLVDGENVPSDAGHKLRYPALSFKQITARIQSAGPRKRKSFRTSRLRRVRQQANGQQKLALSVALTCQGKHLESLDVQRREVKGPNGTPFAMANPSTLVYGSSADATLQVSEFADLQLDHFNPHRRQAVWVRLGSKKDPREQPFFYQAIRRDAVEAVAVPFQQLSPWLGAIPSTPVLVFSIGRCGSTLFSQIAKVAGLPTWSEPDTFTNLCRMKELREDRELWLKLGRVALNDLAWKARAEGDNSHFAIKFRGRVTHIGKALSAQHPDSKSFFLVREPLGWAKSFGRHFNAKPKPLAHKLDDMIKYVRNAKNDGMRVQILDYADMLQAPEELCGTLSSFTGKKFRKSTLSKVMATDSQAGTGISRASKKELPEDFIPEFVSTLEKLNPALLATPPSQWLTA